MKNYTLASDGVANLGPTDLASVTRGVLTLAALLLMAFQPARAQTQAPLDNTVPLAGPQRPATVPHGYVITPAGYFHSSCVRSLSKGERLLADGRVQHEDGAIDQEVAVCAYPHYTPTGELINSNIDDSAEEKSTPEATVPEISGWLEDAYIGTFSNTTSYGALIATWTVPPQPTSDDGQTLYFFPGFEGPNPTGGARSILQPVLGWGGGQWGIASWNCCLSGIVTKSPTVTVSPGDKIYGSITSTCAAGTLSCATWNVLSLDMSTGYSTTLADTPSDGQIFNLAFGAVLEPYDIVSCSDYPSNGHVNFSQITVFNQNLKPLSTTNWTTIVQTNAPPQCNYSVTQEDSGHEITLHD